MKGYPPDFGWVSMVLVTERYRRRGLATLLLQKTVDHLLERDLVPMLDATPEGRAVYSRVGSVETEQIDRWQGTSEAVPDHLPPPLRNVDRYALLDRSAFGASRIDLLNDVMARPDSVFVWGEAGYAAARRGRSSMQIGPVVAWTGSGGRQLLRQMLALTSGPIVADVAQSSEAAVKELSVRGFRVQRRFHRMAFGQSSGFGDLSLVHAIAGPELG